MSETPKPLGLLAAYRHLLGLARALRLAQKGNRALGVRPDPDDAKRLEAALDYFIAEHDRRKVGSEIRDLRVKEEIS